MDVKKHYFLFNLIRFFSIFMQQFILSDEMIIVHMIDFHNSLIKHIDNGERSLDEGQ